MSDVVKRQKYRVDDWASFRLEFRRESDGTYTIWCLEQPHNPHGGSVQDHHLYSSGQVCVSAGREPRSLARAIAIAQIFMNSFCHWCATGQRGRTGGRVNV